MGARTWSTQTELGRQLGLSAREVGDHLTAAGVKRGSRASEGAVEDGLAVHRTLRDGTEFAVWHTERALELLRTCGVGTGERNGGGSDRVRAYDRIVATDGSALRNPGPTGWAWVDQTTGETGSGGLAHGTNNIGELLAVLHALRHAGQDGDVLVRSDSTYVINVAERWARGWQRRGWRKADGSTPENVGIVQEIVAEIASRSGRTAFEWVRGHDGDRYNEQADALAVAAARAAAG